MEKLRVLAESAKYDVSCSSSGTVRGGKKGMVGNTVGGVGICHSFADDGRCISLLKVMLTNHCMYDCAYCINRRSNDIKRATLSVTELEEITMEFYRRNYIEGLFLSSGVVRNPDYTMERLTAIVRDLRTLHRFNGYIHLKAIPGASQELLNEAGRWADRMSVNIEIPKEESLKLLAPDKDHQSVFQPMKLIQQGVLENKEDRLGEQGGPPEVSPCATLRACRTIDPDDCGSHAGERPRHPQHVVSSVWPAHHAPRLLFGLYQRQHLRQAAARAEAAAPGT